MDLSIRRRPSSPSPCVATTSIVSVNKLTYKAKTLMKFMMGVPLPMKILVAILSISPILITISSTYRSQTSDPIGITASTAMFIEVPAGNFASSPPDSQNSSQALDLPRENLLGGLLVDGLDKQSCRSRYQSSLYRRNSQYNPSPYLVDRLRKYEELHKQCGPSSASYQKAVRSLKSHHATRGIDCKYIVWISFSGLGNRILSLASTFLYALLTNRVLLVDRGHDMADLFCEPFPYDSWFLPHTFSLTKRFNTFNQKSENCYGNILKKGSNFTSVDLVPSFIYLHLVHDYNDHDKLFFCDQEQTFIKKVPWLILKSDNYFVPSLFLIPSFENELQKLFPEKETVFHHLGRYLFHPSKQVWGLIIRYYEAYLSKADEKIGIQIRVFDTGAGPFPHVMDQILSCVAKEKLLPNLSKQETMAGKKKLKAVLMTSLRSDFYEKMRNMFWEHSTVSGDVIGVYQPSHEGYQQTTKHEHNRKAWAEMYLLSMMDVLVTSAWSTFGYVAQGLGGLKPWILYKPENHTAPNPPCVRDMSMEPCFHAPPFYDCKARRGIDTGAVVPHVRHCEDMSWGLKLVDSRR